MQSALKRFDIFPKFDSKFEEDARDKTFSGAILSILALLSILYLVIGELSYYTSIEAKHDLYVDTDVAGTLGISINVTFHKTPCDLISIDVVDSFGEFQEDLGKHTVKHQVDKMGNLVERVEELINSRKNKNNNGKKSGGENEKHLEQFEKGCGSCYGAESHPGQCCNTCDEVREAYQLRGWSFHLNDVSIIQCAKERLDHVARKRNEEGCNIFSTMNVKRVQGNLHFVPGRSFVHLGQHIHDIMGEDATSLDLSHTIHFLQFGEGYPGLVNPLDNTVRMYPSEPFGGGKWQYFVKVVPTRYEQLSSSGSDSMSDGKAIPNGAAFKKDSKIANTNHKEGEDGKQSRILETNQYSVTQHFTPTRSKDGSVEQNMEMFLPGVFFIYDLSPIKVHIYESRPYSSLAHFILQLCAISGGVFTVLGLMDSCWYHGVKKMKRKMALGKQS